MSFCSVMNIEEELDEVSHIISNKLDKSIKEIYVINSIISPIDNEVTVIKNKNKTFYFVQFLPSQYNYKNINNETDGYIDKDIKIKISNYNDNYQFYKQTTLRFYYKIKN